MKTTILAAIAALMFTGPAQAGEDGSVTNAWRPDVPAVFMARPGLWYCDSVDDVRDFALRFTQSATTSLPEDCARFTETTKVELAFDSIFEANGFRYYFIRVTFDSKTHYAIFVRKRLGDIIGSAV